MKLLILFLLGRDHVPFDHLFDLFQDDEHGPLWRASFAELDEAKRHAQKLADDEGCVFFVFNCRNSSEVARLIPTRGKSRA